ncbi:MFS transporter [Phycicoccus sp. Root101]|uniref:MFS transporter n=1 Tax=Phycicoccus sp. Root101 TaxID=1736421 RepID=UPI0009E9A2E8|nr:MFS transporter [Phycicoccus sp. Root101]
MTATATTRPEPTELDPPALEGVIARSALPVGRARTIALLSLFLASTMELLDNTIVNVALPTIESGLGATASQLQWMVAAYPLAFAVGLITGSRLGDLLGRKRMFVAGLVGFTVLSAACGLAPTPEALVVFRALQGLASAAMIPQVLSSIQVMYAPHERAKAMGLFTGLAGTAAVAGPVVGALLTEADILGIGWRSIFLVNVPVGVFAVVAALRWVPESVAVTRPRLDARGVALLAGSLLAVLYPLTMGRELGWPAWVYAVMAVGVVGLVAFVSVQRRSESSGREPLVALSLYRGRAFAAGSGVYTFMFAAMGALFIAQTIYFQAGLGWSVLKAGLAGLPFALTTTVTAGLGVAVLGPRIGRRVLMLGGATWAVGALVMAATVHGADASTSTWAFLPGLMVSGAGFGLMVAPVGAFTLADVPVEHAGSASGLFSTTGQLANAVGVAVIGTVFFSVVDAGSSRVPSELFGPAFQVALCIVAGLMVLAGLAARAFPATAGLATAPEPTDDDHHQQG